VASLTRTCGNPHTAVDIENSSLSGPQVIAGVHMVLSGNGQGERAGVCTGGVTLGGGSPQGRSRYARGAAQGDADNFPFRDYAGPDDRGRARARPSLHVASHV